MPKINKINFTFIIIYVVVISSVLGVSEKKPKIRKKNTDSRLETFVSIFKKKFETIFELNF